MNQLNDIERWEKRQEKIARGVTSVEGILIPFSDNPDGNGRVYSSESFSEECLDNFKQIVEDRRSFGEFFGSLTQEEDVRLEVNLGNVTHLVSEIEKTPDGIYGTIDIINTPKGLQLKDLLKSGVVSVGMRGTGTVNDDGEVTIHSIASFDFLPTNRDPFRNIRKNKRISFKSYE